MHIAFYAPLKSPTHSTPSGDRRVAGLLMEALQRAGHRVELVSTFRSYDAAGDAQRQAALRAQGEELAQLLVQQWRNGPAHARPDLWFTYHVYYKAPDWLGPRASAALGIPYVIVEASYAPKRALGPWAIGHDGASDAIRRADLILSPTRYDIDCLRELVAEPQRIAQLPPFLDHVPFRAAAAAREAHRARLAAAHALDGAIPWIVVAAMMRPGDKLSSYRMLAAVLGRLGEQRWHLLIAGDGPARADVEAALATLSPGRARLLGALAAGDLQALYAAGDVCIWPAINEAYGMAMLEAQAAGVPVVSCDSRGVPDVVVDGRTGRLAPPGDEAALAGLARSLLSDGAARAAMGRAAAEFVALERGLDTAARRLDQALAQALAGARRH